MALPSLPLLGLPLIQSNLNLGHVSTCSKSQYFLLLIPIIFHVNFLYSGLEGKFISQWEGDRMGIPLTPVVDPL